VPSTLPQISIACVFSIDDKPILASSRPTWEPFADELVIVQDGQGCLAPRRFRFDFAAKRNALLEQCTKPWVLMMDADELLEGDPALLLAALTGYEQVFAPVPGVSLPVYEDGQPVARRVRLFRPGDGWRYRFAVDPLPLGQGDWWTSDLVYPMACVVHHQRRSMRVSSLDRKERYIMARLCQGDRVPDDELEHYQTALDFEEEA
jgi:hypothetical protein